MSTETTARPIRVRRMPITGWGGLCRPCADQRGITAPGTVWTATGQPGAVQRGLDHLARHHAPAGEAA